MKTVIDCAHLGDKKKRKDKLTDGEFGLRTDKLDNQTVRKRCEKRKHIFA